MTSFISLFDIDRSLEILNTEDRGLSLKWDYINLQNHTNIGDGKYFRLLLCSEEIVNSKPLTDVVFDIDPKHSVKYDLASIINYTKYEYIFLSYDISKKFIRLKNLVQNNKVVLKLCFPKNYADFRFLTFLNTQIITDIKSGETGSYKFKIMDMIYINIYKNYKIEEIIDLAMRLIYYILKALVTTNKFYPNGYISVSRLYTPNTQKDRDNWVFPEFGNIFSDINKYKFPEEIDLLHHGSHIYKISNVLDLNPNNWVKVENYFGSESILSLSKINHCDPPFTQDYKIIGGPYSLIANLSNKHIRHHPSSEFNYNSQLETSFDYLDKIIDTLGHTKSTLELEYIQYDTFYNDSDSYNFGKLIECPMTSFNNMNIYFGFLNFFYDIDLNKKSYEKSESNDLNHVNFLNNILIYLVIECCNSEFSNFVKGIVEKAKDNEDFTIFYNLINYIQKQIETVYLKLHKSNCREAYISKTKIQNIFYYIVNYFFIICKKRIENKNLSLFSINYLMTSVCFSPKYKSESPFYELVLALTELFLPEKKQDFLKLLNDKYNIIHTSVSNVLNFQINAINEYFSSHNSSENPILNIILKPFNTFLNIKKMYLTEHKNKINKFKSLNTILEYIKIIEFYNFYFQFKFGLDTTLHYNPFTYEFSFLVLIDDKYDIYHLFEKKPTSSNKTIKEINSTQYKILKISSFDIVEFTLDDLKYKIYLPKLEYIDNLNFNYNQPVNSDLFILNNFFSSKAFDIKMITYEGNCNYTINTRDKNKMDISQTINTIVNLLTQKPYISTYIFKINGLKLQNHDYLFDSSNYASVINKLDKNNISELASLNTWSGNSNYLYHSVKKKHEFNETQYESYIEVLCDNVNKENCSVIVIYPIPRNVLDIYDNYIKDKELSTIGLKNIIVNFSNSLNDNYLTFTFYPRVYKYKHMTGDKVVIINLLGDSCLDLTHDLKYLLPLNTKKLE